MRIWVLGAILLAGCAHDLGSTEDQLMRMIEQSVALPEGAAPLSRYRRHYAWASGDPQAVEAVYTLGGKPDRLWLSADDLPIVLDGGCSVVTFKFEVARKTATNVRCN